MEVPGTTINCLYCQAVLSFSGLPAVRYADHLSQQHRILFRQVSCAGPKSAHKILKNLGASKGTETDEIWS